MPSSELMIDQTRVAVVGGAERLALLDQALARAPHDLATVDTWLFTYGAMLEDPPFSPVSEEVVACEGWSRRFCLSDPLLRGTAEEPGVVLGLVAGDQCAGVAWRLLAQTVRADLARVFEAELQLPFYKAAWARVTSTRGEASALVLIADDTSPLFQPTLTRREVIERLGRSRGEAGTNAQYLENVVAALDHRGVPDLDLTRLLRDLRPSRQEP